MFLIGVAIKIAVLMRWRKTSVSLANLMICSLRFNKRCSFSKMLLCFEFCAFGFEAIPHPNCYLTSIVDKTHHGPVIAPFSVQHLQLI